MSKAKTKAVEIIEEQETRLAEYPALGQTVNYMRAISGGAVECGKAVILAIAMDADKRPICHVEAITPAGEVDKFNLSFNCVNPTPEQVDDFEAYVIKIDQVSKEGNGKVQAIVDEYNAMVKQIQDDALGQPIEVDDLTGATKH